MKLILLTYYIGIHDEVMDLLGKHGVCTYTRWPEVEGRISCGEPREGTHVWPGANSALMTVVDDGAAGELLEEIEAFNRRREGEGLDAFVLDVAQRVMAGEGNERA
jgi:hypothetical protein